MHFKESLFWIGIATFETGLYCAVSNEIHSPLAITLIVVGLLACAISVYSHHRGPPKVPFWIALLAVTWGVFAYGIVGHHISALAYFQNSPWSAWGITLVFAFVLGFLGSWDGGSRRIDVLHTIAALPPTSAPIKERLFTISFPYLPGSPIENGWILTHYSHGSATFMTDPEIDGSLQILPNPGACYAMDYILPAQANHSKALSFTAKIRDVRETMIFAHLNVTSRNGSTSKMVWFKFLHGPHSASPTASGLAFDPKAALQEQSVYMPATVIGPSLHFNVDLEDAVMRALGRFGWIYNSIQSIRLRGPLSISSIDFWRP